MDWENYTQEENSSFIQELQCQLALNIMDYSRSQVDYWRQVPKLCLEINGYDGWNGTFSTAYQMGLWRLESGRQSYGYHLTVDLATGELTAFNKALDPQNPRISRRICALDLAELDAKALLLQLAAADTSIRSYTNVVKITELQKRFAHIEKLYTRKGPIPEPYYGFD